MARILEKRLIRQPDVFYFKVAAPLISKKAKAGQFVIIRLHDQGERIPLSLADIDPQEGTISLIVMAVGKTTHEMVLLKQGDDILDHCGPLGQPTHIESVGRVVLVGGGFGVAPLYPIARAFKAAGHEVTVIMGASASAAVGRAKGKKDLQSLFDLGMIEVEPLTYIRGRSMPNQYLIVDEAQNLTPHEIKTIITRAGEGTKVVLTGDPYQIDNPYIDSSSNGLTFVVERFKDEPIAGHITLVKGERSDLAELAATLL